MTHTNTEAVSDLLPCPLCGVAYEQKPAAYPLHEPYAEHPRDGSPLDGHCIMSGHMFALLPQLVATWNRRSASNTGGVEVKALEWKEAKNGDWHANSEVGEYAVGKVAGYVILFLRRITRGLPDDVDLGGFDTTDEAKAVAQADFNQRILSAIVSSSVSAEVTVTDEQINAISRDMEVRNMIEHAGRGFMTGSIGDASEPEWAAKIIRTILGKVSALASINGGRENG